MVRWYFDLNGRPDGPVLTSRLRQMAREGKLRPTDFVRRGAGGSWTVACEVDELVRSFDKRRLVRADEEQAEIVRRQPKLRAICTRLLQTVRVRCQMAHRICATWGLRLVLATLAVVLGVRVYHASPFGVVRWATGDDPLAVYESFLEQYRAHRDGNADSAAWEEFSRSTQSRIEPIIATLELEASPASPDLQQLLWAGRDYIPRMCREGAMGSKDMEVRLKEYLSAARQFRADVARAKGSRSNGANSEAMLILAVTVTLADICCLAWLGSRVFRHRVYSM